MASLNPRFLTANELGVRLEIVGGIPLWEAQPVYKHQKTVDRISASTKPTEVTTCECVPMAEVYVGFPDCSLKRPDISIFCREPDEEEEVVTLVPEAVVVFNPYTQVSYVRKDGLSPLDILLQCG